MSSSKLGEYCNPGCDPEFNGRPSSICKTLCGRFPDLMPEQPMPSEKRNLTPLDQFAIASLTAAHEHVIGSTAGEVHKRIGYTGRSEFVSFSQKITATASVAYEMAEAMLAESKVRNSSER